MDINVEQLQPGIVVEYRLRPDQQPTNPDKIWHGRVLHLFVNHSLLYDGVMVEITNPGFEGGTEFVHLSQLTNIIRAYSDVQKPCFP